VTAADIAAGVVLAGIASMNGRQALRLWGNPGYLDRMMLASRVLPFRQDVRRGAVRGAVPLSAALALAAAGVLVFAVFRPAPGRPGGGAVAVVACFALMLIAFGFHFAIIWFNRPRWLVPPHMRADEGTLTAWFGRRNGGQRPGRDHRSGAGGREEKARRA
jgi:hypothetical protein